MTVVNEGPVFSGDRRELLGQTVVIVGGSSGIGLATAKRVSAQGANVILSGLHDDDALRRAAADLGALSTAAFDADDPAELERFFSGLPNRSTT